MGLTQSGEPFKRKWGMREIIHSLEEETDIYAVNYLWRGVVSSNNWLQCVKTYFFLSVGEVETVALK